MDFGCNWLEINWYNVIKITYSLHFLILNFSMLKIYIFILLDMTKHLYNVTIPIALSFGKVLYNMKLKRNHSSYPLFIPYKRMIYMTPPITFVEHAIPT